MGNRFGNMWARFWMHFAGLNAPGRLATRLATWFAPPYHSRLYLARLAANGYVSARAVIHHKQLCLSPLVYIDDGVVIFQDHNGGSVKLASNVHLWRDTFIQTGDGGSVSIGADTHIQPRCQFSAYKGHIRIGSGVEIAPSCAFYPYDHGVELGTPINCQPLQSKGPIVVGDGAWLGVGVIVLAGVRIGEGAVIGAGSVVTRDIPDGAIAVGNPAKVVKFRGEAPKKS